MNILVSPVRTEAEYEAALREISRLMDAQPGTPDFDRLDVLATLVQAYEKQQHPIALPDPIAFIEFRMEQMGWTRKNLEPLLGSRGRVSEIMNRERRLTLAMMHRMHEAMGIPYSILVQTYPLRRKATQDFPHKSPHESAQQC